MEAFDISLLPKTDIECRVVGMIGRVSEKNKNRVLDICHYQTMAPTNLTYASGPRLFTMTPKTSHDIGFKWDVTKELFKPDSITSFPNGFLRAVTHSIWLIVSTIQVIANDTTANMYKEYNVQNIIRYVINPLYTAYDDYTLKRDVTALCGLALKQGNDKKGIGKSFMNLIFYNILLGRLERQVDVISNVQRMAKFMEASETKRKELMNEESKRVHEEMKALKAEVETHRQYSIATQAHKIQKISMLEELNGRLICAFEQCYGRDLYQNEVKLPWKGHVSESKLMQLLSDHHQDYETAKALLKCSDKTAKFYEMIDKRDANVRSCKAEVLKLKCTISEELTKKSAAVKDMLAAKEQLDESRKDAVFLGNKWWREQREFERALNELKAYNEELKASNGELTASHEELKASHEDLTASNADLKAFNEELNASNEDLKSSHAELKSSNAELKAFNEDLTASYAELKASQEELKASQEELKASNADLKAFNEDLTASYAELKALHVDLKAFNEDLTASHAELKASQEELTASYAELKALHVDLKAFNEDLTASHEELKASNAELNASHEELKAYHGELTTSHVALKASNEDLNALHEELKASSTGDLNASLVIANKTKKRMHKSIDACVQPGFGEDVVAHTTGTSRAVTRNMAKQLR